MIQVDHPPPCKGLGIHLNSTAAGFLLSVWALAVYGFFASRQHNWDGAIQEVVDITTGNIRFNSRHLLYTVIGYPYYLVWRTLGYTGDATIPLQVLNAFVAAVGVFLLFNILMHITASVKASVIVAFLWAFSYAYWYYTEETWYNVLGIAFVVFSLFFVIRGETTFDRSRWPYTLGWVLMGALAVLTAVENIISLAAISLLSVLLCKDKRKGLANAFLAGLLLCAIVTIAYLVIGRGEMAKGGVSGFVSWLNPFYTSDRLPMYTGIDAKKLPVAIMSLGGTFLPISRGLRLRGLFGGEITPDRIIAQISLLFFAMFMLFMVSQLVRRWSILQKEFGRYLVVMFAWLIMVAVFTIWFDPWGSERWLASTIPFAVIVAILVADSLCDQTIVGTSAARRRVLFFVVTVSLVFLGNLTIAIGPDHFQDNPDWLRAQCVAGHMGTNDVIISPAWDWSNYMSVLGRRDIQLLSVAGAEFGKQPDGNGLVAIIDREITNAHSSGGRALLVDTLSYNQTDWDMIHWNTGLTKDDFELRLQHQAFQCYKETIWEIGLP